MWYCAHHHFTHRSSSMTDVHYYLNNGKFINFWKLVRTETELRIQLLKFAMFYVVCTQKSCSCFHCSKIFFRKNWNGWLKKWKTKKTSCTNHQHQCGSFGRILQMTGWKKVQIRNLPKHMLIEKLVLNESGCEVSSNGRRDS